MESTDFQCDEAQKFDNQAHLWLIVSSRIISIGILTGLPIDTETKYLERKMELPPVWNWSLFGDVFIPSETFPKRFLWRLPLETTEPMVRTGHSNAQPTQTYTLLLCAPQPPPPRSPPPTPKPTQGG